MLPCKGLVLALVLCLDGLQVHLPSLQVVHLLLKVGRIAVGTLVLWRESRHLLSKDLTIDVIAQVGWSIAVNVVGVVL